MVCKSSYDFWVIVETRLPLAGEKTIRYRPADVSFFSNDNRQRKV